MMLRKVLRPFVSVAVGLGIALVLRAFFCPAIVVGDSMLPTYHDGEVLLAVRVGELQIGDVVVFHTPSSGSRYLIKRVVGVPGDELMVRDGVLYRNGEESSTSTEGIWAAGILSEAIVVPDGHFFLMGDNRNNSTDSRTFGPVSKEEINYVVIRPVRGLPEHTK